MLNGVRLALQFHAAKSWRKSQCQSLHEVHRQCFLLLYHIGIRIFYWHNELPIQLIGWWVWLMGTANTSCTPDSMWLLFQSSHFSEQHNCDKWLWHIQATSNCSIWLQHAPECHADEAKWRSMIQIIPAPRKEDYCTLIFSIPDLYERRYWWWNDYRCMKRVNNLNNKYTYMPMMKWTL